MSNLKLLDCTLRDGGYITSWYFGEKNIYKLAKGLTDAKLDYVEVGYLNSSVHDKQKSIFDSIKRASEFIPKKKGKTIYLAMADVDQFSPEDVEKYKKGYIDGIRVVFYKHQIEKAMIMCKKVANAGYKLFIQPMVTIDYTIQEYSKLIDRITTFKPYAISIVDSFGYMNQNELKRYFDVLDSRLDKKCIIGFHSHNNMQLSVLNAQFLLDYKTKRTIIIDSSLFGMGRGAGNLNTELIANFYNEQIKNTYNISVLIKLISDVIYPIYKENKWGYSPYFYLTALNHCHPNYVTYLLSNYDVSIEEFSEFVKSIPPKYKIRCRKDSTLALYEKFKKHN